MQNIKQASTCMQAMIIIIENIVIYVQLPPFDLRSLLQSVLFYFVVFLFV